MKVLKKLLYAIPLAGMIFASCTDVEKMEIEHIGGFNTMDNEESEAYYAELRAYKETARNYGRPVAFGWFSNWGTIRCDKKGISDFCSRQYGYHLHVEWCSGKI